MKEQAKDLPLVSDTLPAPPPIHVTRTFLPPLEEYMALVREAWDSGWVTNNGVLVRRLEQELGDRFALPHPLFVGNGTIALQLALRALDISGEVITTPYSYVASTTAILWERCTPVFADIDPVSFCLDPARIEALITPRTQAILATHVYGLPCDVDTIERIARKHGLQVIYDGAHAFGTDFQGRPLLSYGDVSTCSFHATKIFHTVEGGLITCKDGPLYERLRLLRAFGQVEDDHFAAGINGKNSEMHAAMGLANLGHFDDIFRQRAHQWQRYRSLLDDAPVQLARIPEGTSYNHSYFPVVFRSEEVLRRVLAELKAVGVFPRRYFYPSITDIPYIARSGTCPIAERIAVRVCCLPLFHGHQDADIDRITGIIRRTLGA